MTHPFAFYAAVVAVEVAAIALVLAFEYVRPLTRVVGADAASPASAPRRA